MIHKEIEQTFYFLVSLICEKSARKHKKTWSKVTFTPSWWRRVDSNHRSVTQQIYSLPPLATRELLRIQLELVDGLEPPTC